MSGPRPGPRGAALLIGYGNPLRGDDAIGYRVAEAVEARGFRGVSALCRQQLAPELAEPIAAAARVVFLDARLPDGRAGLSAERLWPPPAGSGSADGAQPTSAGALDHAWSPTALLSLARAIYGRAPQAWLVTAPAPHRDLCEHLSPAGRRACSEAAALALCLLSGGTWPASSS